VTNTAQKSRAWNYATDSIENKLNTGNPGYIVKFLKGNLNGVDKLNASIAEFFDNSKSPWDDATKNKDIIKFAFEAISNDNSSRSQALVFRAFLGSITDNHSAELNSFKYLGRGENFRTYQGFDRSISFSFKIFAQSGAELKPLYQKLNDLISQVYPDYSPITSIMRAPLVRLTIGDYVYRTPGFLESVNVTIDGQATWEINDVAAENRPQLPHVVEVSISFKPIMDILPRRRTEKEVPALIANNKVVQNATQYTSITQKIEQQRQEDINTAQTKINEENKVYQALLDFNTQQL
jgi:hypothetical protein